MVAPSRRGLTADADILVVGAGPTGLTTALQAHDHGATVRLVERRSAVFRPSRAMVMHPRTLECLRPLGVTDALLERADRAPRVRLHLGDRVVAAELADVALTDTAFPHLTLIRQMDVEEVLIGALDDRGIRVERAVELVDAVDLEGGVRATLRRAGRTGEEVGCRFLAGCDGQASTVRDVAGIGWRGGPYREEVVLADLELDGGLDPRGLHVVAAPRGLVFLFPLGEGATWRLLATRPSGGRDVPRGQAERTVPRADVESILDAAALPATVRSLAWATAVRLQHRLADTFRSGALFLAGDAAHAHSPAAAQGMNTGIVDAVNLGWKLAFAVGDCRHEELLDSYDLERRPVARQVLALTSLVFFAEASSRPLPSLVRGAVVPLLAPALPLLVQQRLLMAAVVRLLSQGWVRYRQSPLSVEGVPGGPGPRSGDRLPDATVVTDGRPVRLHELTARPGVHVLLSLDAEPIDHGLGRSVAVHRIASWPGRGLSAVRPDGHVGFRSAESDRRPLCAWLDSVGALA